MSMSMSKHKPMTFPLLGLMEHPPVDPDICASRHGGNEQSQAAYERIEDGLPAARQACLDLIRSRGRLGATAKEVAERLGKPLNAISGRLSELKAAGLVVDSQMRLDGCAVLVAAEFAPR